MVKLRRHLLWLHPGMHVKRWVALACVGFLMFMIGTGVIIQAHHGTPPLSVRVAQWIILHLHAGIRPGTFGLLLTLLGGSLAILGMGKLIVSLTSAIEPEMRAGGLVDVIYQRRRLSMGHKIVVIGGGTGLSTMLRGLKRHTSNITAIVTVADDGGSSGKIRKQLNILPPGDIRNCLVALADSETQMTELFQYRFRNSVRPEDLTSPRHGVEGYGEGLRDHAFGNLLIAAMCAINNGDFEQAVRQTSRVLNIRGRVLPSTVTPVHLRGELEDGSVLDGETRIAESPLKIKRVRLMPITPDEPICPVDEALDAIATADVIVLGPGSVFTSILPNLLVPGIAEALVKSRAKRVYVCNVMTQPGETDGFSAADHVRAIEEHTQHGVFQFVLVNVATPDTALLEKYRKTGSVLVEPDLERIRAQGYRPLSGNFIHETEVVSQDAEQLAKAIIGMLN